MEVIWKFDLELTDSQKVEMPKGAKILCVDEQDKLFCLWAIVDPDPTVPKEERAFRLYGTGNPEHSIGGEYIGTINSTTGFVWHIFEGN